MNFSERMIMHFRLKGLSENDINLRLLKYYSYSKLALLIFVMAFIVLIINNRLKIENLSALFLYFIWFAVSIMMFIQLRNHTKRKRFDNGN
jgi:uncharacterized membrane protein